MWEEEKNESEMRSEKKERVEADRRAGTSARERASFAIRSSHTRCEM